ncbi:EthD family reductase [Ahrensia sp. R2A130]|uniref:EthD family reductase n=1 Tax=Ahrensia sp. R2A130 TaxID=744979 RepID=UPI0001E0D806|nr:EthD family reductase [Ahrensia sp. R2A130]EFL90326.1 ethyl tert-butyl ether degradation EthD [Ahrensia sp. R2A130]
MAQLVAVYRTPKDAIAFDAYYASTHLPLAKTIPGLLKYELNDGPVAGPDEGNGVHLVAILHFANMATIHAALASPEGQAAAADLGNFATGGAELLMFDTKEV